MLSSFQHTLLFISEKTERVQINVQLCDAFVDLILICLFGFRVFPEIFSFTSCLQSSKLCRLRSNLMLLISSGTHSPSCPHFNFTKKLKCHFRFLSASTKLPTELCCSYFYPPCLILEIRYVKLIFEG